uniref:Nramp family divalent metal transporter n=1 Tax=Ningiella ruwaisensis TaxID=2364274 RepID=UPI00109FB558|nr:Nramp family divalent metal transporter [Ningiella ruwaisensis]
MRSAVKGLIVTAAFIGPGTVTTASIVGAELAYQLVWALVFALIATCVLQEMASRLGRITGIGLSEAILTQSSSRLWQILASFLICTAIGVGNAAYEGGNLTGAALGLSASFGLSIEIWAIILGIIAASLLLSNAYKVIEAVLVCLVGIMSVVFISLMFVAGIDTSALVAGIRMESCLFSDFALLLAIIGTTIVPYNLFLHAGMSARDRQLELGNRAFPLQNKEQNKQQNTAENTEQNTQQNMESNAGLFASIGIGGLVTFAVMSSAATAYFSTGLSIDTSNIAAQLEPLLGEYAKLFFALGLFAAGLTSAITAPLAASYAISGLFKWQAQLSDWRFKAVSISIIVTGVMVSVSGIKPFVLIVLAQATNAILLPISAILLLIVCNNKRLMGAHRNSGLNNMLGIFVVMVVLCLGAYKLFQLVT